MGSMQTTRFFKAINIPVISVLLACALLFASWHIFTLSAQAQVGGVNNPPVAGFVFTSSGTLYPGSEVFYDGSEADSVESVGEQDDVSHDIDGTIASWRWVLDTPSGTERLRNRQPVGSFTADTAGDYTLELLVTDDDGATDSVSKTVTVSPAPDSSVSILATPTNVTAGNAVDLSWSFSNVEACVTQSSPMNAQWQNINPDATGVCGDEGDGSCSGSDSTKITNLTEDTTFSILCDSPFDEESDYDDARADREVSVNQASDPSLSLQVSQGTVSGPGDTVNVSWDLQHVSSCTASSNPTSSTWNNTELTPSPEQCSSYTDSYGNQQFGCDNRYVSNRDISVSTTTTFQVSCDSPNDADLQPDASTTASVIVPTPNPNTAPTANDDPDSGRICAPTDGSVTVIDVMQNDIDPDNDDFEIANFTQPTSGTVSIDDNGTPGVNTDDKLAYYPSSNGNDSFRYRLIDTPGSGSALTSATATVSVAAYDSCESLSPPTINADPGIVDTNGSTTLSWSFSYRNSQACQTADGNNQWRNIDVYDETQTCSASPSVPCGESDSVVINNITSDTTFTLQCDTTGNGSFDTATSTTVNLSNSSVSLSASDGNIDYGASTTLSWSYDQVASGTTTSDTGNAQWANTNVFPSSQSCQAVGNGLCTGAKSTDITNLTQDTTFTVTFQGTYGGTFSDSVTVDVADGASTNITASPDSVSYQGSTTLNWSFNRVSTGTTSSNTGNAQWANIEAIPPLVECQTVGVGNLCSGSGNANINNLTQDTTFTVTYDPTYGGTPVTDSATVSVADKPVELSADPSVVDQGGTTDLTWSDTGMDDCVAGSNPTNPSWTSGVNPDPAGGVKTNIGIATTTDFTLSCEDTALGSILSDTVTVYLRGFSIDANLRDIWGIQLPGSVTTQSRVAIDPTPNFTDNIQLAASSDSGLADDVTLQFLDDGGNSLGASTLLSPSQFDDGVWLQARVDGMDVPFGETPINITATAANGSTTDQIRIYLHLRGVWEL